MRFAVTLPNVGDLADPRLMVELGVAAERAGWDGFFVWDHIVVDNAIPVGDAFVQLAAVAAVTLDHLSGGRLVLGVGLGFPPDVEFGTFGEPTDSRERAELLDEGLDVLQGMWSGRPFGYQGRHFTVRTTTFAPVPLRKIPIWVAGTWPNRRPFRRAARFDGVTAIRADMTLLGPDEIAEIVAYLRSHRQRADPFEVSTIGPPDPASVAAYDEAGPTWYQVCPAQGDEVAAIRSLVAAGPPR